MATVNELRRSLTELLAILRREERHPQLCTIMEAALASGVPSAMQHALTEFDKLSTCEIMRIRRSTERGSPP